MECYETLEPAAQGTDGLIIPGVSKRHEMWHLGAEFRGGSGSFGLAAGLDDLSSLFQQSYDSMKIYNKTQKFTAEVPKLSHHKTDTGLTISRGGESF